jgi:hypothetical protein
MSFSPVLFFAFSLFSAHLATAYTCGDNSYDYSKYNVHISWEVLSSSDTVRFTFSMDTTGWMGIGFEVDRHDMRYGDYLIVSYNSSSGSNKAWFVGDYNNGNDHHQPSYDKQQDCTLISASQNGKTQTAVVDRKINTLDSNDYILTKANNLLWAYGDNGKYVNPHTFSFTEHSHEGYCSDAQFV